MMKLERYWMSNRNWLEFTKDGPVLKEDAPEEARESYKKYLEQMKSKQKAI